MAGKQHIPHRKPKGFLLLLCLLLGLSACNDRFAELNVNPNQPTTTNPDFLWTEVAVIGAGQFNTHVNTEIWSLMEWTMMMGDLNGYSVGGDPYAYSGDWNDALWNQWYTRLLSPTNEILKLTQGDPFLVNKHSIARIWRAWAFHRVTDLWGDVPYFDAIKGVNGEAPSILTPSYDAQSAIYADLLNELKEAAEALDPEAAIFAGADPYYSGDITAWRRFAHTLRLRLALRISNADPALAQQHGTEVLNSGDLISAVNEGMHFNFTADARGPFEELSATGQGMRNPSHFLIEMLKSTSDPRLAVFAEPTTESLVFGAPDYTGVPNLFTTAKLGHLSDFNTSPVGPLFLLQSTPGTTLSYAESCFLQAEAALKGWGGDAQGQYEAGVRAHIEQLGLSDQEASDYLATGGAWNGSLEQIITQKWLSFVYRDGFEAFAEYRRTGFPVLRDTSGTPIPEAGFPQRLAYPPSEISLNGSNVTAVGAGINDFASKVWWAQ